MKKQHLIIVLNICFTAALIGGLYFEWLTTPFPDSWFPQKARLLGFIGAVAVGALSCLWIRKPLIIIVAAAVGLVCSATWIEYCFSDTVSGMISDIIGAVIHSVENWLEAELILLALLIGSWFVSEYLRKKINRRGLPDRSII